MTYNSKTPNFDKVLNKILENFKPCQRNCQQCGKVFDIFQEDIEFYRKLMVPAPTLCPDCRMQRRLGYRINFLPIFYKKSCSAPGHNHKIISFYSENNPIKVYCDDYYYSDKWDALEFGKDYDWNKSFFEQFNKLTLTVPHQSLQKDPKSIDCDYVISGVSAKGCYYVGVPYYSENVYYSFLPVYSKECIDVSEVDYCHLCYQSVYLDRCYNCNFCYECSNCLDGCFLYDCRNCTNCFACVNLRSKQYYFFNKSLTKEEYQAKMKEINLGKRKVLKKYQDQFEKLLSTAIRKNLNNKRTENSLGNNLKEARNCFYAFRAFKNCENLRYAASMTVSNNIMDFFGGGNNSFIYESTGAVLANKIKFSIFNKSGLELEYCIECTNCQYCFGCVELKNKEYCIFNKQYGEKEYWQLVDKIKIKMLKDKEYGEFFPLSMSCFPYQDSNAQIEFPLEKQEIIKNGWHWQKEIEKEIDLAKFKVLKTDEIPDDIKNVSDDILNSVIICEKSQMPFRITKFELKFYRNKNLPIPTIHPLERIKNLFIFRYPYKLWQYPCSKCGQMMYSGYDSKKNYKVYCEACYLKEVV